jgi:hypothetical protein
MKLLYDTGPRRMLGMTSVVLRSTPVSIEGKEMPRPVSVSGQCVGDVPASRSLHASPMESSSTVQMLVGGEQDQFFAIFICPNGSVPNY